MPKKQFIKDETKKGVLLLSEKSDNKLFQFSVWKNFTKSGKSYILISIKMFKKDETGSPVFRGKASQICFSIKDFEYFKNWIATKKKK